MFTPSLRISSLTTLSALALVLTACGSSGSDGNPSTDSGTTPDTTGSDSVVPDGGSDSGTDAKKDGTAVDAPPADTTPPPGTKLASGDFSVVGVTSDDQVIAFDNGSGALVAVPLAGGTPATIDATSDGAIISGKVVFSWSGTDSTTGVGSLHTWTKDGGVKAASTASIAFVGAASDDGANIVFTSNATSAPKADLVFATVDLATKKTLGNGDASGSCGINVEFHGARFVASYCSDGTNATIASVDNTGTATTLLSGALPFFSVDTAGTKVFAATTGNAGSVFPIEGGTGTSIDTGVAFGAIASDASRVVYRTTTEGMKATPLATVAPIALVTTGAKIFGGISPDGKFALYSNNSDGSTGLTDLFMVATTAAGATPTTLNSKTDTDLTDFAASWTADSSHVLYSSNVDPSALTGDMNAMAVTGGTATVLGKDTWQIFQLTGSKILINDGFTDDGSTKRADIRVGDAASTTAPTLLVSQAGVGVTTNKTKTKIVYDFNVVDANAGLYVMPLP